MNVEDQAVSYTHLLLHLPNSHRPSKKSPPLLLYTQNKPSKETMW